MKKMWFHPLRLAVSAAVSLAFGGLAYAASASQPAGNADVKVIDGVVMPRRPVPEAVAAAMQFLKKADGGYVPGKIDGELAGYFTSAHVNEDGSRSNRKLAYPARQHAYFIFTFLRYYAYTGEQQWLLRARDLADWNMGHSTPPTAVYANLPYSTTTDGKPGGNRDGDCIEPDKAAFLGSGYLAVYEVTSDRKYLEAAGKVAETLVRQQRENGSWPFRVVPETNSVVQDFGGAAVFYVEFFERLSRYDDKPAYRAAHDRALKYMLDTHVTRNEWGTYHEDVRPKDESYLSAEPMSFTADYLFRHAKDHPEYTEMGRRVLRRMEERLVHTDGHAAAPAPAVSEQAGFDHIMPGHTARYCLALAHLYEVTGDEDVKRRALSGMNATTYMQGPTDLFRTFFYSVNPKTAGQNRPNWYSQHLYTVCHVLEAMPCLPELAPAGEDHILGGDVFVRNVTYANRGVSFETIAPSTTSIKLALSPKSVRMGNREMSASDWSCDARTRVLKIRHEAGNIVVSGAQ